MDFHGFKECQMANDSEQELTSGRSNDEYLRQLNLPYMSWIQHVN